jgi:hypothetical protein
MSRRPAPYGGDGLRGYEIFTSYSRDIPERDELVAEKRAQGLRVRVTDISGTSVQSGFFTYRVSWWFPVSSKG